jgi:hypothetical protein
VNARTAGLIVGVRPLIDARRDVPGVNLTLNRAGLEQLK